MILKNHIFLLKSTAGYPFDRKYTKGDFPLLIRRLFPIHQKSFVLVGHIRLVI